MRYLRRPKPPVHVHAQRGLSFIDIHGVPEMSSMPDGNQKIADVSARLETLSSHSPDTSRGIAVLGKAGDKTHHLDPKTR